MTSLSQFAAHYIGSRAIGADYAKTLTKRAAALELYSGTGDIRGTLQEPVVNKFLRSLVLSPYTVRSYRGDFLTLWNSAADDSLVPYPIVRKIFRPKIPDLVVECFTLEEVRALQKAVPLVMHGGYPNGVGRAAYWSAAIPLAWDAGFRRGDVWRFRRDSVQPGGLLRIVQHKTKNVATVRLRPNTLAALDAIGQPQPCRWMLDRSFFGRHFKRIVKASGVNRGTFKWLRRASGSYVEMQQAGAGRLHLGHTDPRTFERFYDAKLGGPTWPMPPEL